MTERDLRSTIRGSLSRGRVTAVATVLVLAGSGLALVRTADLREAAALLVRADPLLVGTALVIYLLSWPLRGRRYGSILAAMDRHCGASFLTWTVFASQTANLVVPARGGDGVRAYLLKELRDTPYPTGVASLAVERAFDMIAIATLGGFALAALLLETGGSASIDVSTATVGAAGIGVLAIALSALTVVIARSDRRFAPAVRDRLEGPRLSAIGDAVIRFGASVRVVFARPRVLGTVYLESVAIWMLDVLVAVLVFSALLGGSGESALSTWTLLVVGTLAVSVGNLAKVLPLSQGGLGLYEAAFTGLVVSVAPVSIEVAVTAAILDHALKNVVTLGGGAVATATLGTTPRSGRDGADPADSAPPG
jgi:uncharacterized protein (TIRG00374 family)